MFRASTPILIAATLSGCTTLGSSYVAPAIAPAARYEHAAAGSKTITAQMRWWRVFGDATLDRLIATGLGQNLTVAQAVERVVAARASAKATGFNAQPGGTSALQANVGGTSQTAEVTPAGSAAASLSWEVDLFGGLARQRDLAEATLGAAIEEANGARLSLIGEIARNYVQARGYQDRLHIARSTLEGQRRTLAVTEQRNAAGVTSALDLAQLKGDVSTTAAAIPALEIALSQTLHRLGVLLGQAPTALDATFRQGAQIPRVSARSAAGIPADLMRDRPDIRQAERQLAAATAAVGVAEADLYPSLTLGGNLSIATIANWSLGPSLSLPIFNRGQLKANVELEQSRARQAYLAYRQAVLEAVEEVENALVGLSRQQTRRAELARSYTSYSEATELAEARYAAGETTLVTLLTAQRSLYSARDTLAQSTVDVALQYIALSLALGGGWDAAATR